jgi:hypothetical protein
MPAAVLWHLSPQFKRETDYCTYPSVFRFLEAVVITVGIIAMLSLLTLSQEFVTAATADASTPGDSSSKASIQPLSS